MNSQEILQALYDSISESLRTVELQRAVVDNRDARYAFSGAIGAATGIQESIKNLAALNGLLIAA